MGKLQLKDLTKYNDEQVWEAIQKKLNGTNDEPDDPDDFDPIEIAEAKLSKIKREQFRLGIVVGIILACSFMAILVWLNSGSGIGQ